jgi:5-methylcytosine-specific restriction endonuclease McrA
MIYRCVVCGVEFKGKPYRESKYCSMKCRDTDWHNAHALYLNTKKTAQKERERKRLLKKLAKAITKRIKQLEPKQARAPLIKRCAECGGEFVARHGLEKYCSDKCRNHHNNAIKEKRIYRNGKPDLSISLTKLYMRDFGVCALCGRHIDFDCDSNSCYYPSIDHIIPLSKGGRHSWDNVQLACRICNAKKSNKI